MPPAGRAAAAYPSFRMRHTVRSREAGAHSAALVVEAPVARGKRMEVSGNEPTSRPDSA
jgi:hypothetical protein